MTERMLQRADAPALRYWDDGGEAGPGDADPRRRRRRHELGPDRGGLASEFRVLRLDLRGHGRSGHIDGALTLDDFVRDVVDVLDACAVPAAHIVGFSLGGMIAQGSHCRRRTVCAGWSCSALSRAAPRKNANGCRRGWRSCGNRASPRSPARRRSGGSRRTSSRAIPIWWQQRMRQLQENHAPSYAAAYTVFSTSDLGDRLHAIRAPTLIATGEHDVGSNPRMARFMHAQIRAPGSRSCPACVTASWSRRRNWSARLVRDFLRE